MDGEQDTYFITAKGLKFLGGEEVSPTKVIVVNDQIVDSSGSMIIEQVRFRNIVRHETLIRSLKRLIKELPSEVRDFVLGNQMSLI